ncbi:MAG: Dipeptide ABC transporter, substrate-binding protein DppA (TC 3.A.1.5.2) [Candidatus Burkholderia crenata]|nr:MAG: Dipeptide ABC transporter, substrate-binding protein DppA (TC 3.A.1.5.2) [Candidatus Burkholderia crenata]
MIIRFDGNPDYWKPGAVKISKLIFSITPDAAVRWIWRSTRRRPLNPCIKAQVRPRLHRFRRPNGPTTRT